MRQRVDGGEQGICEIIVECREIDNVFAAVADVDADPGRSCGAEVCWFPRKGWFGSVGFRFSGMGDVDVLFGWYVCAGKGEIPELLFAAEWGGQAGFEAAVREVFDPVWASFCCCGLGLNIT